MTPDHHERRRSDGPLMIGIVDHELIWAGLRRMLAPSGRAVVVPMDLDQAPRTDLDVVLFDPVAPLRYGDVRRTRAAVVLGAARPVVFTWGAGPRVDEAVRATGARAVLSKSSSAEVVIDVLEAVVTGATVTAPVGHRPPLAGVEPAFTAREIEILELIALGLTNQEIAERCYLSINSIKTHIRSAYRKIGATSRSQAVGWVLRSRQRHGLEVGVVTGPTGQVTGLTSPRGVA